MIDSIQNFDANANGMVVDVVCGVEATATYSMNFCA